MCDLDLRSSKKYRCIASSEWWHVSVRLLTVGWWWWSITRTQPAWFCSDVNVNMEIFVMTDWWINWSGEEWDSRGGINSSKWWWPVSHLILSLLSSSLRLGSHSHKSENTTSHPSSPQLLFWSTTTTLPTTNIIIMWLILLDSLVHYSCSIWHTVRVLTLNLNMTDN